MELHIIAIPLLFFFLLLSLRKPDPKHKHNLPGPRNLPFIGNLHHLLKPQPPHKALHRLSTIYGPIMHLKLGEIHAVIISSAAAAKEIMKTHDITYATRPINTSISAITYGGKDIAFAPYGEFWRQMRRLCVLELLSAKRVRSFRSIREQEMTNLIRLITASAEVGATIDLSGLLLQLTNNITSRAAIGDKSVDQTVFQATLAEVVKMTSGVSTGDLFPSMPFIGSITGFHRKLQQCHLELDRICEEIVQGHRKKRDKLPEEEDITDVLLRIQGDESLQFPITDDHIKAVITDLLNAGTETTATAIAWTMSELIRNPSVMRKAQREVRVVFGRVMESMIAEEGVSSDNLSYLRLVIKESLRLHPPFPLLLPRESQKSCEVMGYEIPAKMTVMVNAWTIGRDPSYWDEPLVFRPERFENSPVDFKGGHFEFIPFGAGRRICPGMQFALATIEMALAHLLYYFDWKYLAVKGEEMDMSEGFGMSGKRMFPLRLLPIRHIPHPDN